MFILTALTGFTITIADMKEQMINALLINLNHTAIEIDHGDKGTEAFWWFGNQSIILYHYRDENNTQKTQYIELPEGITMSTYSIAGYLQDTSSLILTLNP